MGGTDEHHSLKLKVLCVAFTDTNTTHILNKYFDLSEKVLFVDTV